MKSLMIKRCRLKNILMLATIVISSLLSIPLSAEESESKPLIIMDNEIPRGSYTTLSWNSGQNFQSIDWNTPVLIKTGVNPGPTLCMTSTIHGDEINGIEIIRRVFKTLDVQQMHGNVIGVPIVNLDGFLRSARYLSDRSDLNRFFPGQENGSTAQRVAYSLFNDIIVRCDALLDLHTGSLHRVNMPQVRANLKLASIKGIIDGLSDLTIIHSKGNPGMLRNAANDIGIPAVTLEVGGPFLFDKEGVEATTDSILNLIAYMKITRKFTFFPQTKATFNTSTWVRSDFAGIYISDLKVGATVSKGDIIGRVADPISNREDVIASPFAGKIIGLASDQFIHTGFAVAHVAYQIDEKDIEKIDDSEDPVPALDVVAEN
ncbi:succinylglutamate desuccinylase/aspartoacylase family protein [Alkalimarinus sediminis]|uniref:Succinylglutamate desuccinylase/aspartoacylase family protein n=1 Tax=Alkalimarinus sediminis TaxID=1632866 RepID=A0A9E8KJ57_9ALTE|nr:succinylglutamate desuccinylase/aspartoacylase family protein [Alkalimarinus sediminis]UZW74661.1 succinylglutamate desuccinylase/aspartoacylase family protein [Alkalimarinus sediminis]